MSARNNGHGRADDGRRRRTRTVAAILVVALVLGAFGIGYVLASGNDDDQPTAGATSATESPSPSAEPSESESPSTEPSVTPTPEPASDVLPDGRHYVYAKKVTEGADGPELTFDLAYFLTGEEAAAAAEAHGDESPPPNDYYVVNDNPKLRTMPIAADAIVRYVPEGTCCALKMGNVDAWIEAVNGTAMTDYPNPKYTGWWLGVEGGVIVRISEQWVP